MLEIADEIFRSEILQSLFNYKGLRVTWVDPKIKVPFWYAQIVGATIRPMTRMGPIILTTTHVIPLNAAR